MGFDREGALVRVGGDEEILKEIAELFLEDAPELMKKMKEAIEAGDPTALEKAAHTIKGAVSNFGAEEAVAAALALETLGRNGNLADADVTYKTLKNHIDEVCTALAQL